MIIHIDNERIRLKRDDITQPFDVLIYQSRKSRQPISKRTTTLREAVIFVEDVTRLTALRYVSSSIPVSTIYAFTGTHTDAYSDTAQYKSFDMSEWDAGHSPADAPTASEVTAALKQSESLVDPQAILRQAIAELHGFRMDEARRLVSMYRRWRKLGGKKPFLGMNPPSFYADSFRAPVSGDQVATAIVRSSLTTYDRWFAFLKWIV